MVDLLNGYEDNTSFLDIAPYNHNYLKYSVDSIPLEVLTGDGVNYTPDINIKVNDLSTGDKNFLNLSGNGDKFRIKIIIKDTDTFSGAYTIYFNPSYQPDGSYIDHLDLTDEVLLIDALDYWIRHMTPLMVHSRAVDIKDGLYVVTGNNNRKQTFEHYTIWDLEFTQYTELAVASVYNTGTYIQEAIKNYQNSKKTTTKKTTTTKKETVNTKSSAINSLKKCTKCKIVYSKTTKNCECVMYVQYLLQKQGFYKSKVDGWYGNETLKAVKKFQQKYKTKYKLTVNGKCDKKTLEALYKT